jgi:hypothetical protein
MDVILSGALRINTMPCRYKLAYVIDHFSMIYCEKKKTRGRLLTDRETFNEIEVFKTDFNPLDN